MINGEAIPPSTSQLQPMRAELKMACICSRGLDYTSVSPNQQETQLVRQLSIITQTISLQFPTNKNTEKELECFKRKTTYPVKVSCMFILILIKRLHFATAREEKRIIFKSDV